MASGFHILHASARSILSPTTGFIKQAGFSHSLTPARNCTYGCTYCYVPTMRIYAGLRPDDWQRWGQFTTFKSNAGPLLERELRPSQIIYCSPLVDPYQPAEAEEKLMPRLLQSLLKRPPSVFVVQTRGPLVVRDTTLLRELATVTTVRISFSLTTNRDEIRRLYEPHCATFEARVSAIEQLRSSGLDTYATLAPLLPCDPELLAARALSATENDLIGDPLHNRVSKKSGATTREAAARISEKHALSEWHSPDFQASVVQRIRDVAIAAGRRFEIGPEGFSWLART